MNVGIVGHEAAKFTPVTEGVARAIIRELLRPVDAILVSGRSPLGGIDVWAEEEAEKLGRKAHIYPPATMRWETGFKPRNLEIAATSDVVHCIVVKDVAPTYRGLVYRYCYHCHTDAHVKSGGCYTALRCPRHRWHVIAPDGTVDSYGNDQL